MKEKKIVYYDDPLKDDFAGTKSFKHKPLPKNFKFYHKSPLYWFFSGLVYYIIAIPVFWIVGKVVYGFKIRGKRKFRKTWMGKKGFFVYGNHTCIGDAFFAPVWLIPPRRTFVLCSNEAVSKAALRPIETMIGALPLPSYNEQRKAFLDAIEAHIKRGHAILIFPEAHIWPYSTRIRPFTEQSFTYPASLGRPVVATCVTYEKRKILRFLPPRVVMHVSGVFEPDMSKPLGERTKLLREQVYTYMVEVSSSLDNYESIRYLPRKKDS